MAEQRVELLDANLKSIMIPRGFRLFKEYPQVGLPYFEREKWNFIT